MIKSLITALALSTLCIPQVQASSFTENDLLAQFEDMGGRVYIDSELCDKYNAFGIQQGASIHLCTEPHGDDIAEWNDTIRHEVWHIVQMCNKGPLSNEPAVAIAAAHEKGWTTKGYKPDVWHLEAEAHWAADTYTAKQIANDLITFCS